MIRLVSRLLLAAVAGYLVVALLQALFLEVLLGGRVAPDAAWSVQLAGLAGTIVSGLAGGWVAARIGAERPWLHGTSVLVPLLLDTVFVIARNADGHPLWFDLGGSATLMAATLVGCGLRARAASSKNRQQAAGV